MSFTEEDFWEQLEQIVDLRRDGEITSEQATMHLSNLMTSRPGVTVVQMAKNIEAGATVIGYQADSI